MPLLLTILSVLAAWALLALLAMGLFLILKPLQGVQMYLQKIAMGVRAIEQQTAPLGPQTELLRGTLEEFTRALRDASDRLRRLAPQFGSAGRARRSG